MEKKLGGRRNLSFKIRDRTDNIGMVWGPKKEGPSMLLI